MNYRVRVLGLTISLCGIKTNLLRSTLRRFIETVPKPTHDAKHADLARRSEHHVQQHLAFDVKLPGLGCVHGTRLGKDLDRSYIGRMHGTFGCHLCSGGVAEPAGGHRAAWIPIARSRSRHAIAET